MKRRDFLKLGGLISASALLSTTALTQLTTLPVETTVGEKIYRGTYAGEIHVSQDRGNSWQLHTSFGSDYSILDIFTGLDGQLYSHLGFKQHTFHLALSQDERAWLLRPFL